jgi:tetratricopeptide (TPR) repeat protein
MITALVEYLSSFYQAGNVAQMEVIARSMLAAIPDDLVALQFLGLALYQTGRVDEAYRAFKSVAAKQVQQDEWDGSTVCEPAGVATFRAATRAHSGLADGWHRIGLVLNKFGFHKPAARAFEAALAARGMNEAMSACAERTAEISSSVGELLAGSPATARNLMHSERYLYE